MLYAWVLFSVVAPIWLTRMLMSPGVTPLGIVSLNQHITVRSPFAALRLRLPMESVISMRALLVSVTARAIDAYKRNTEAILTIIASPERWKRGCTGCRALAGHCVRLW